MYSKQTRFFQLNNQKILLGVGKGLCKLTSLGLLLLSLNACSMNSVREYIEEEGGKSGNWVQTHNGNEVKVVAKDVDGPIVMNDAETDVLDFPSNASILVSMQGDENIEMKLKREGVAPFQIKYTVDGIERSRQQMSDAQLTRLWQHFFRRTGLSLENRSQRIINNKGIDGLLSEITKLNSNSVTRRYLSNLSEQYTLNDSQIKALIEIATGISSNNERSRAYLSIVKGKTTLNESQLLTLIEDSATISSNSTLSDLLSEMLEADISAARTSDGKLSSNVAKALLKASAEISSNSQLASFLKDLVAETDDAELLVLIVKIAKDNISSNASLSGLLVDIVDTKSMSPALFDELMLASKNISSSSQREKLLSALVALK